MGDRRAGLLARLLTAVAVVAGCTGPTTTDGPADGAGPTEGPETAAPDDERPPDVSDAPGANTERAPRRLPEGTTVVWSRDRLPDHVIEAVRRHDDVADVAVVSVARRRLVESRDAQGEVVDATDEGWWRPLETLAVDPADYAATTGLSAAADLGDGRALLSASSARVRDLGAGGRLRLADGARLDVVAEVPDQLVGAADLLVAASDATGAEPRYLLARPAVGADSLPAALADAVDRPGEVAVRGRDETPVLRHADSDTAPARRKAAFGEFAMRPAAGRTIDIADAWVDEHIATAAVPLLGEVTCHREALDALEEAMSRLQRDGHGSVVGPGDRAGCYVPRAQSADGPLSSHAWGVAIDLDPQGLPQGSDASPPRPLVEAMARAGFTNGEDWLLPDPMHFELAPDRRPARP